MMANVNQILGKDNLIEVFRHLRLWPLQCCRLVCKYWKRVADSSCTCIIYRQSASGVPVDFSLDSYNRNLKEIKPSGLRINSLPPSLWPSIPADLRSLELGNVTIQIIPCTNLEYLELSYLSTFPTVNMDRLIYLHLCFVNATQERHAINLSHLRFLRDLALYGGCSIDFTLLPNTITKLKISGCTFAFEGIDRLNRLSDLTLWGRRYPHYSIAPVNLPSSLRVCSSSFYHLIPSHSPSISMPYVHLVAIPSFSNLHQISRIFR